VISDTRNLRGQCVIGESGFRVERIAAPSGTSAPNQQPSSRSRRGNAGLDGVDEMGELIRQSKTSPAARGNRPLQCLAASANAGERWLERPIHRAGPRRPQSPFRPGHPWPSDGVPSRRATARRPAKRPPVKLDRGAEVVLQLRVVGALRVGPRVDDSARPHPKVTTAPGRKKWIGFFEDPVATRSMS